MGKLIYCFNRIKEPSTHAAFAMLFQTLHLQFPEAQWSAWINALSIFFGILAVFIKEYKPGEQ